MPEKSLQVTRLRLVTWKDFSDICDLEKPILALPPHRIVSFPVFQLREKDTIPINFTIFSQFLQEVPGQDEQQMFITILCKPLSVSP